MISLHTICPELLLVNDCTSLMFANRHVAEPLLINDFTTTLKTTIRGVWQIQVSETTLSSCSWLHIFACSSTPKVGEICSFSFCVIDGYLTGVFCI